MSTPSKIPYVRLGQSGLKVSKVILGCMSYGDVSWQAWVLDEEASLEHFKAAYDLGINTVSACSWRRDGRRPLADRSLLCLRVLVGHRGRIQQRRERADRRRGACSRLPPAAGVSSSLVLILDG